ncbi:uncharacterized protein LOC115996095 isoform X1 [Ipomoea triloba]|uniref:uncharacterized protein LOC115996095 isoform X1 n=2 Tax=Ipomoea triloba TaxID=35885 RepID=UPI00125E2FB9|nr:uncharacterized protein LOC115996095 isoform X1 [Ipomoea triloba]
MAAFIKQMRMKFSGAEEDNKDGSRRTIAQKSQSLKDTKRGPSWLERQLSSRRMSQDYDSKEGSIDYAVAVAAAAYAIKSLEDSIRDQRKGPVPEKNVTIRTATIVDTGKPIAPTSSIRKAPTFMNSTNGVASSKPEIEAAGKIDRPAATSFRKTPTFGERLLDRPATQKPGTPVNLPSRQFSSQPSTPRGPSPTKVVKGGPRADVWEQEELDKIRKRYEKLNSTIDEWETKKTKKAKRHLEETEADLDTRRAKALAHYRNEVERIVNISEGAKRQAEQNQQNEELKVKEKASKYRYTGNAPSTCWCL